MFETQCRATRDDLRTEAVVFEWTVQMEGQTSAELTEENTFLVKFILSE